MDRVLLVRPSTIAGVVDDVVEDLVDESLDGKLGRRDVSLYDEFSRHANGALAGKVPLVGNAWTTSGAQPTTVTSGTASSSGTGYAGQIFSAPVQGIACELKWAGSGTAQAMTLITSTDVSIDVANAVHFNFGPKGFNLTVRKDAGTFDSLLASDWRRQMKVDNATVYRIGMEFRGDTVFLIGPNGEPYAVTDSRIGLLNGTMAVWEPVLSGSTEAKQVSAAAYTTANTGMLSPLDMPGLVAAGFTTGLDGTTAGSRSTGREVSIGLDASTGLPAIMFGPNSAILAVLQTAVSIGATSLVLDQWMPSGTTVQIESGTNTETVTTSGASTGTGPYTAPLTGAVTKAHSVGVAVSGTVPSSFKAKIYDNGGTLIMPGAVQQGSGTNQVWLGGGPGGTGVFIGNAFDVALFRAGAGVFSMLPQQIMRQGSGTTAQRKTAANAGVGGHYFDTTLGKPIWSDGTNWKDATGATV
jgi:hypothetical protein